MTTGMRWTLTGFAMICFVAGCGGPPTASLSGNVTYEGKPIPAGLIMFVPDKGDNVSTSITDGRYSIEKVPVGEMKVVVTAATATKSVGPPKGAQFGWEKKGPPKDAPIPAGVEMKSATVPTMKIPGQYGSAENTPLKYTVTAGKHEKDFELK